jgi:hypothetical protein
MMRCHDSDSASALESGKPVLFLLVETVIIRRINSMDKKENYYIIYLQNITNVIKLLQLKIQ